MMFFLNPGQNVALLSSGARALTGVDTEKMMDGKTPDGGYSYAYSGTNLGLGPLILLLLFGLSIPFLLLAEIKKRMPITVELSRAWKLNSIELKLWNGDDRKYKFYIEVKAKKK